MKIGRNDPCPCGSGVKFKKCCLQKVGKIKLPEQKQETAFETFVKRNCSIELVKLASVLQMVPENHSKLVRLEDIQDIICSNLNNQDKPVDFKKFKAAIQNSYKNDYREDPSEASFTENLIFINGNNVVFPGIAHESTKVNQHLLKILSFYDSNLSEVCQIKIREGSLFMLHIHNQIAKKLGYARNIFKEDYGGSITFPEQSFFENHKDCFEFSESKLQEIYNKLQISSNVIEEFTSSFQEIIENKNGESVLIKKPFIKYQDKYYLTMPTSEMYALNLFIIRTAKGFKELEVLSSEYVSSVRAELAIYLHSFWKEEIGFDYLTENESIYQFDANKYAYVCFMDESSKTNYENRANEVIKAVKKDKYPECDFLALHVFAPFSIETMGALGFNEIEEAKYQMAMSSFSLERIITYWEIDKLSFWKYIRAKDRAEKKGLSIAPFFSILTYFKWYKRNKESFLEIDNRTPDVLSFDFTMQGEVVIESNKKNDRHLVPHFNEIQGPGFLPVYKTQTYAPIYTSEEIFIGKIRKVLKKYNCPIWISCKEREDTFGINFIDAILYWLNELHEFFSPFFLPLKKFPIEFILVFDERLKKYFGGTVEGAEIINHTISLGYEINPEFRKIEITFPLEIFKALHRKDNYGEKIIIGALLRGVGNLSELYGLGSISDSEIKELLNRHMPLSQKKMILTSNSQDNIVIIDSYIPKPRYIYEADTAIVLEENVNWLDSNKKIPEKITKKKDRIKLCYDLIDSLIKQLRIRLKDYNSKELLVSLMLRHEAILQSQANRDLGVTPRLKCFSHYEDVVNEYNEFNSTIIKSSHAVRSLIEFVLAEPYFGNKTINDDDNDFLIAIMSEIINYGAILDSIKFDIDDPWMGLLPSGRIGMSHNFYDTILKNYRDAITNDEIVSYSESFASNFQERKSRREGEKIPLDPYYDKVDEAFLNDIGISLPTIMGTIITISNYTLRQESSYGDLPEQDFLDLLKNEVKLTQQEINSFLDFMVLETRGKIDMPPEKYEHHEIFPWRYNRKLSYVRRPVLKITQKNNIHNYLWSIRHLKISLDNLLAIFHNGTLKVEKKNFRIQSLLAERNKIKGDEFRKSVYEWLYSNTSLKLIPHEVKIKEKGFFKADKDYGDVDIFAMDLQERKIYSIECKNTKQAKIMYDFQNSIRNYIDKQLPKHLNRGAWIENNLDKISGAIKVNLNSYKVESLVITSNQVPVKFIESLPIEIYSFNELKVGNHFGK